MNNRQKLFIAEYLVDLNATQAAIRAGYSPRSADVTGARLLGNAKVRAALDKALGSQQERTQVTADRVVEELGKLAFSNMLDYMTTGDDGLAYIDLSSLTREQAAAIQEVTVDEYTEGDGEDGRLVKKVKVKLADKKGPLELLGKRFGLWVDRHELSGAGGKDINVKISIGERELTDEP